MSKDTIFCYGDVGHMPARLLNMTLSEVQRDSNEVPQPGLLHHFKADRRNLLRGQQRQHSSRKGNKLMGPKNGNEIFLEALWNSR